MSDRAGQFRQTERQLPLHHIVLDGKHHHLDLVVPHLLQKQRIPLIQLECLGIEERTVTALLVHNPHLLQKLRRILTHAGFQLQPQHIQPGIARFLRQILFHCAEQVFPLPVPFLDLAEQVLIKAVQLLFVLPLAHHLIPASLQDDNSPLLLPVKHAQLRQP